MQKILFSLFLIFFGLTFGYALVPLSIYDLDLGLANACWLVTTAGLGLIIPFLSVVMRLMG
jgi:hypothetical protein